MPWLRGEIALFAALLGTMAACASSQDAPGLAELVNGTGGAGGDSNSGGSAGAGASSAGDTSAGSAQSAGGVGAGGVTGTGAGGFDTSTGGFDTGTGGFDTGTGGFDTGTGGTSGTGGLPGFPGLGTGGTMSAPDAGSTLKAECAQKLCIDPVFDCVLQGCGFAACTNLHCIVQ
jgi:hypothetical protein